MILKDDKFLIVTLGPCQVSCGSGEKVIYFQGSGEQALTFGDLGSRGNGQLGKQYSFNKKTHRVGPYPDDQGHTRAWAIKLFSFSFAQFTMISVQHKVLDLYFRIDHSEIRDVVLFHTNLRRSVRQRECTVQLTECNHVTSY